MPPMHLRTYSTGRVEDPTRDESDTTQNGMKPCEKHAVLASVAASKNSHAHVAADQEVSVKMLAEELKTMAEVWTHLLFQVSSFAGAHTTVDPKRFDVHDHHREGDCSGSRRETLLHCLETEMRQSFCPCVRFMVADAGCISECPLRVANGKVCYCTGVTDDLSSVDRKGLNYQDCKELFHINRPRHCKWCARR